MFKSKKKEGERNKNDDKIIELVLAGDAAKLKAQIDKKKHTSLLAADDEGRIPIFEACRLGFKECVELLVKSESDATLEDEEGRTCLHVAAERGFAGCVTVLLQNKVDPNMVDRKGQGALHYAAQANHVDVLQSLLAFSAELELLDQNGNTALMTAVKAGQVDAATTLVNAAVNVNAVNRMQKTALMLACEHGNVELVRLLLARGAKSNFKDTSGRTALAYARENNHEQCVGLLPADADPGTKGATGLAPTASPTTQRKASLTTASPAAKAAAATATGTPATPSAAAADGDKKKDRITVKDFKELQKQLEHETAHGVALQLEVDTLKAQLAAFAPEDDDVNFDSDEEVDLEGAAKKPAKGAKSALHGKVASLEALVAAYRVQLLLAAEGKLSDDVTASLKGIAAHGAGAGNL